jgi:hypothetical protein
MLETMPIAQMSLFWRWQWLTCFLLQKWLLPLSILSFTLIPNKTLLVKIALASADTPACVQEEKEPVNGVLIRRGYLDAAARLMLLEDFDADSRFSVRRMEEV